MISSSSGKSVLILRMGANEFAPFCSWFVTRKDTCASGKSMVELKLAFGMWTFKYSTPGAKQWWFVDDEL